MLAAVGIVAAVAFLSLFRPLYSDVVVGLDKEGCDALSQLHIPTKAIDQQGQCRIEHVNVFAPITDEYMYDMASTNSEYEFSIKKRYVIYIEQGGVKQYLARH